MPGQHLVVHTKAPAVLTLRTMGQAAREAANTWTFREWAATHATRAKPRDYIGQLEQLYRGILRRWRYVQEPDEWVHGTGRSMIRHVLGTKYNGDPDPTRTDLARLPAANKGWGDCDDIASATAAGALALGMTPYFRVARGPSGAHVSVVVRTPRGKLVSLDPVGHPEHPFGWALPSDDVQLFDLDAQPANTLTFGSTETEEPTMRTYFSGFDGIPTGQATREPHWCAVPMGDFDGPRVLVMPRHHWNAFRMGQVVDGAPAVDEFGNQYRYDARRDLWLDQRLHATPLGALSGVDGGVADSYGGIADGPMGSWWGDRHKRRRARRKRRAARRKRVRKFFRRIGQKIRAGVAKVMGSRIGQNLVGAALQFIGVPRRLTKAVMAASAEIIRKGGIIGLIRLLRKDPKAAARIVAAATRKGLQAGARMFGPEVESGEPTYYMLSQGGRRFVAQPVMALAGLPGMYELGELEVSPTPTPGAYYRIQKGDTLLGVTSKAYGVPSGSRRLERAHWVNDAVANRPLRKAPPDNLFKSGLISFRPQFAEDAEAASAGAPGNRYGVIWIPEAKGDEPPEAVSVPPGPAPTVPEFEPAPGLPPEAASTPPLPPVVDEGEEEEELPPLPLPPRVAPPVEVTPAPAVPDHAEPPSSPTAPPDLRFAEACTKTGGRVVWTPKTGYACVRCESGTTWSHDAGRCIPALGPTRPTRPAPTATPIPTDDVEPVLEPPGPSYPPTIPPPQPTAPGAGGGGILPIAALLWATGDLRL